MDALESWLAGTGRIIVRTREPGGSHLGRELRRILLDTRNNDLAPRAELFLYLADRSQHVETVVRPALERGAVVLSDRYADSTIVYQGYGRGLDVATLHTLNETAVAGIWPDLTLVLDLDPATGLARATARNDIQGIARTEGRFEAESLAFHTRVREGFLDWAARHSDRCRILNAEQSPDALFAAARKAIEAVLD